MESNKTIILLRNKLVLRRNGIIKFKIFAKIICTTKVKEYWAVNERKSTLNYSVKIHFFEFNGYKKGIEMRAIKNEKRDSLGDVLSLVPELIRKFNH